MLHTYGRFVTVGIPDEPLPGFNAMSLLGHGAVFGGSHSASKEEYLMILQLAVHKSVKPHITLLPMSDAQEVAEAVKRYELKCKYGCVDAGFRGGEQVCKGRVETNTHML
jgi:alcohol dehydrogenase (NADP+)